MRRVVLLSLVLLASLALHRVSAETQVIKNFAYPPTLGAYVGSCNGFDILSDGQLVATFIIQYDKDGQTVKTIEQSRVVGQARIYNSTDGTKQIVSVPGASGVAHSMYKVGDVYMGAGVFWKIILPGKGPIFMDTGLIALDLRTGTIRATGHNQMFEADFAGLCEALK